jgi:hypothetical protein
MESTYLSTHRLKGNSKRISMFLLTAKFRNLPSTLLISCIHYDWDHGHGPAVVDCMIVEMFAFSSWNALYFPAPLLSGFGISFVVPLPDSINILVLSIPGKPCDLLWSIKCGWKGYTLFLEGSFKSQLPVCHFLLL